MGCSLEGGDGSRELLNESGRGRDAIPSVGRRRGVARALQGRDVRVDARGAVRRSMRARGPERLVRVVLFFTASDDEHALHLHHAFATSRKQRRALSILRRFCDVAWDGEPQKTIVVRPRSSWEPLRRWVRARSIAVYWFARTSHLYAPGGVGRKRDREQFEAEMPG